MGSSDREIRAIKSMMTYEQNQGYSKASVLIVNDNTFNSVAI